MPPDRKKVQNVVGRRSIARKAFSGWSSSIWSSFDAAAAAFSLLIFDAQTFAALCLVGESGPRSRGPEATLAHMVERCRFALGPRLFGTGEEEG
jgi:hypothetical protein